MKKTPSGWFVAFALAFFGATDFYLALNGPLLSPPPWGIFFLGIVPASGQLSVDFLVPQFAPGVQSRVGYVQGLFVHPSTMGPDYAGSGSGIVLLDGSF